MALRPRQSAAYRHQRPIPFPREGEAEFLQRVFQRIGIGAIFRVGTGNHRQIIPALPHQELRKSIAAHGKARDRMQEIRPAFLAPEGDIRGGDIENQNILSLRHVGKGQDIFLRGGKQDQPAGLRQFRLHRLDEILLRGDGDFRKAVILLQEFAGGLIILLRQPRAITPEAFGIILKIGENRRADDLSLDIGDRNIRRVGRCPKADTKPDKKTPKAS